MGWLTRFFSTDAGDPAMLDHLSVNVANAPTAEPKAEPIGQGLSRAQKLELAAQRLGRPFKCAGDGVPREIQREGDYITRIDDEAEAWAAALEEAADRARAQRSDATRQVTVDVSPNVTTIKRKKS